MPAAGESWNQFKLLELLGKGGMGEVFLAEDGSLNRKVALKFLPEALQQDVTARERLLREARSAAALDHPYICKIYEIGKAKGEAFIAMEYVQGTTVQDKLRDGPLPLAELVQVGIEIGEALAAAHKKQIVHRDLKAANIMLTRDHHIKVMDFGLAKQVAMEEGRESKVETLSAKLTEHGSTPGTVVYMSPEQVRGEPLDTRSDTFSLGVLLYELATGKVPFQGATSGLTYDAILNRGAIPPRQLNPEVPAELEQVIQKALEKDRENRYQSVKELIVDLRRVRRDSDSGMAAFQEPARPAEARSVSSRWIWAAAALAALVLGWVFLRPPAPDVAGVAPPITSLAVLPFENTGSDPDVDYLSDGIAESLINQLAQLPRLSVMARATAFRYRGENVDPQTVGEELGVGAVLTGRVVQQGDKLNVQAELVETEKGTQIWGQQYEHEMADLITVQNDLAKEISRALRLQLTGDEQQRIAANGTADSEAYQAYLRGRFVWSKRTNSDFKKAIEFFQEALRKDPGYALAYAGLADSYFLLGAQFYGADEEIPATDAIALARSSAMEALRLDENLAEPYATLGFIHFADDWDWDGAEKDFLAALDADPGYATAHQWYALYLLVTGRHDEAIEQAREAVNLEPSSPLLNRTLGFALFQAGQYRDGIEQMEKTVELDPVFPRVRETLMQAYWIRGEKEKAAALAEALDPDVGRVYRLASEDRLDEAREALVAVPALVSDTQEQVRYVLVGDTDTFFEGMEAAVERKDPQLFTVFISPLIDRLRADPRLVAIRQRMGLSR